MDIDFEAIKSEYDDNDSLNTFEEYVTGSISSIIKAIPKTQEELFNFLGDVEKLFDFTNDDASKIPIVVKLHPRDNGAVMNHVVDTLNKYLGISTAQLPPVKGEIVSSETLVRNLVDTVLFITSGDNYSGNQKALIEILLDLHAHNVPEASKVLLNAYQLLEKEDWSSDLKTINDTFLSVKNFLNKYKLPQYAVVNQDEDIYRDLDLTVDSVMGTVEWILDTVGDGMLQSLVFSYETAMYMDSVVKDYTIPVTNIVQNTLRDAMDQNLVNNHNKVQSIIYHDPRLVNYALTLDLVEKVGNAVLGSITGLQNYMTQGEDSVPDFKLESRSLNYTATLLAKNITSTKAVLRDVSVKLTTGGSSNINDLGKSVEYTCTNTMKCVKKIISDPNFQTQAKKSITSAMLFQHPGYLDYVGVQRDIAVHAANGLVPVASQARKVAKMVKQPITRAKKKPIVLYLEKNPYLAVNPGMPWCTKRDAPPPGTCSNYYLRSNEFTLPFVAEMPFDVTLHPPLAVRLGTVKFPNGVITLDVRESFINDVSTNVKILKWHSKQVNQSVVSTLNDKLMLPVHKHMLITRLVSVYYLQRRGKDVTVLDDPVAEALKDSGSLVSVFTRSLEPEVMKQYVEFSNKNPVESTTKSVISSDSTASFAAGVGSFLGSFFGSGAVQHAQGYPLSKVMADSTGVNIGSIVKPLAQAFFKA